MRWIVKCLMIIAILISAGNSGFAIGNHDKGMNAVWLDYEYAAGYPGYDVQEMCSTLVTHGINEVYVNVGHFDENGHWWYNNRQEIMANIENFFDAVHSVSDDFLMLAWINGNSDSSFSFDDSEAVQNAIDVCVELGTSEWGESGYSFDGVHIDYEFPTEDQDSTYILFLNSIKDGIGVKTLSNIGRRYDLWDVDFYMDLFQLVDHVAVMIYDTNASSILDYLQTYRRNVLYITNIAFLADPDKNDCVSFGLPDYPAGTDHDPIIENLFNACVGLNRGLDHPVSKESSFRGSAIFMYGHMNKLDWSDYIRMWTEYQHKDILVNLIPKSYPLKTLPNTDVLFETFLYNLSSSSTLNDIWTDVRLPGGSIWPYQQVPNFYFPPLHVFELQYPLYLYNSTPPGNYSYNVHIGDLSLESIDEDSLDFDILGSNENILRVPNDYETIQNAINAASDGDVVLVNDGTYTGIGNYDINFYGKAITVMSEKGPDNCIIDCQDNGRGFLFDNGEGNNSILQGFTIRNGHASGSQIPYTCGGAILCNETSPTIQNNVIHNNYADESGGGIAQWRRSTAIIENNQIYSNFAVVHGGGIYCKIGFSGDPYVPVYRNNVIKWNEASEGGGLIFAGLGCEPLLINNTIVGNVANTGGGGGLCQYDTVNSFITNSIFCSNQSAGDGKELWLDEYGSGGSSTLTIEYSDIEGGQESVHVEPGCTLNWDEGSMIDEYPDFEDTQGHLQDSSPCVDTGDPANYDNCRPPGLRGRDSDMGAYGGAANCSWIE